MSITGTLRAATGWGGHLMLEYQKSVSTPAGYHASSWVRESGCRQMQMQSEIQRRKGCWVWFFPATSASDVAGFGGRRFLVLQHEEAAKDCRVADKD